VAHVNSDYSTILFQTGSKYGKPFTTMITGIPQQPSGHSSNETFCKEISDSKRKI
jgi:hypothetical protein